MNMWTNKINSFQNSLIWQTSFLGYSDLFFLLALWKKYDHERPDYKTYVKRMKKREKIDHRLEKAANKNKIKIEILKPLDGDK